jgi:hypothetical protein
MQRMREELEDEVRVKRDLADLQQQFLAETGQQKEKETPVEADNLDAITRSNAGKFEEPASL